jgi:iron-sulfur cluster repair protein YtfE (RIC family)
MKGLISTGTRMRDLFRIRPGAVDLLGSLEAEAFSDPRQSLSELFRRSGPDAALKFVHALEVLPSPTLPTHPEQTTIPQLLDWLTHQHREFLLIHLNDLHFLLDLLSAGSPQQPNDWRNLQQDFAVFAREIRVSMEDEEKILFPRILRYDACLRLPKIHPEFHQGSLLGLVANHRSRLRSRLERRMRDLGVRFQSQSQESDESESGRDLFMRWIRFQEEWDDHEALEARILYPRAIGMERSLYNLTIQGGPLTTHQMPGPFDSGLVRLRTL